MNVLEQFRRILDCIHAGGSIWYDKGRFDAYCIIAKLASNLRHEQLRKGGVM